MVTTRDATELFNKVRTEFYELMSFLDEIKKSSKLIGGYRIIVTDNEINVEERYENRVEYCKGDQSYTIYGNFIDERIKPEYLLFTMFKVVEERGRILKKIYDMIDEKIRELTSIKKKMIEKYHVDLVAYSIKED